MQESLKMRVLIVGIGLLGLISAVQGSNCRGIPGTCQDYRHTVCTAGYETGKCPGSSYIRCCKPCDFACTVIEKSYYFHDAKCRAEGGKCMLTSNHCAGEWQGGKCGGPAERKCCVTKTSSGACTLINYSASNVKGYAGKIVRVASDFKDSMDLINEYAKKCEVTVEVTSSYREVGKTVSGAIVTPAKRSNHFVGHAIDMNLNTPKGWCNSSCLSKKTNSKAVCFTDKVVAGPLRWGISFNDPVHIDDALNIRKPTVWATMFNSMQNNC